MKEHTELKTTFVMPTEPAADDPSPGPADELLAHARQMTMKLIVQQKWAYPVIAQEAMPFVRRARDLVMEHDARSGDGELSPDQVADVLEKFLSAMRYYAKVSELEPILTIDLTTETL